MNIVRLKSPSPRKKPISFKKHEYSIGGRISLPVPKNISNKKAQEVLLNRSSIRTFNKRLDMNTLSTLMWYSCKTMKAEYRKDGGLWQHKVAPSAGGIHPIDIFLIEQREKQVYVYNPFAHTFDRIINIHRNHLAKFLKNVTELIPIEKATIIWFGAQYLKTCSRYRNAESLVWRDSGALLATLNYSSEYLGLAFCGLGITGEPLFSRAINSNGQVLGVGGCLVGSK